MRLTEHDADLAQDVADLVFHAVLERLTEEPGWETDDAIPAARTAYWSVKGFLRASLDSDVTVDAESAAGFRAAREALRLAAEEGES